MKIGFGAPVAGAWATPGYLAAFSEQAEEAGYASLWMRTAEIMRGVGKVKVIHPREVPGVQSVAKS